MLFQRFKIVAQPSPVAAGTVTASADFCVEVQLLLSKAAVKACRVNGWQRFDDRRRHALDG